MSVKPGYFYTKFYDETTEQAIDAHSVGYKSIEEAIDDSNAIEYAGKSYVVLNDQLVVVHTGVTKELTDAAAPPPEVPSTKTVSVEQLIQDALKMWDYAFLIHMSSLPETYLGLLMSDRRITKRAFELMQANPTIKNKIQNFINSIEEDVRNGSATAR